MSADVVYEIARYDSDESDGKLLERVQLLSAHGVLLCRNVDGSETICEITDVVELISATASLREIRAGQVARISCAPETADRLPLVLQPMCDAEDSDACCAEVNGKFWSAYPSADGEFVMLPGGGSDEEPDMSAYWAEHDFEEGDSNPLAGYTSIGLATPSVVVEYGRYDHGGFGGGSAVAISPVDNVAAVFIDWLMSWRVLADLWEGDSLPFSPSVRLFATAAANPDRRDYWSTDMDDDDEDETSCRASSHLKLLMSDELIDQIRDRLRTLNPEYGEIVDLGGRAP